MRPISDTDEVWLVSLNTGTAHFMDFEPTDRYSSSALTREFPPGFAGAAPGPSHKPRIRIKVKARP